MGLLLLHNLDRASSVAEMSGYFFVFGLGLGLVMQVLVLIVQNAVPYTDLGVATSGATFFRSIGASFGVSIFGTIFANMLGPRIADALAGRRLPPGVDPGTLAEDPRAVAKLPPGEASGVLDAYSTSITNVFLYAVPVVLLAFALAWLLKEEPLRGSVTAPDTTEVLSSNPVERSSHDECARALTKLGCLEGRKKLYQSITARAGCDLKPAASWMVLRMNRYGSVEPALLAERSAVPLGVISEATRQLEERGLAERQGMPMVLTESGRRIAHRLAAARQEALAELLGDWWTKDRPTDLTELVRRLTAEMGGSDGERPHNGDDRRLQRRATGARPAA